MTTPNLSLVELATNQTNPENVINDGYIALDVLVQLGVINMTTSTPPGSPTNGDRYIPLATATGAWVGYENDIAYYYNGWYFFTPQIGWTLYDQDDGRFKTWSGSAWADTKMEPEVLDTEFRVVKSTDATSKMDFDMSKVATATTTTFIMPNGDVEFAKTKLDATAAPAITNDDSEDYEPGSVWVDITGNKAYMCVDAATGAAVWREMAGATGTGDVTGVASGTDNAITRFDGTGGKTIQDSSVLISDNDELYGHFAKLNAKTAAYTLTAADSGMLITVNSASAVNITIPQTSTETIVAGVQWAIFNRGAGTVTMVKEGTDTIESKNSYVNLAQYAAATVVKVVAGSPNTYILFGDIS